MHKESHRAFVRNSIIHHCAVVKCFSGIIQRSKPLGIISLIPLFFHSLHIPFEPSNIGSLNAHKHKKAATIWLPPKVNSLSFDLLHRYSA